MALLKCTRHLDLRATTGSRLSLPNPSKCLLSNPISSCVRSFHQTSITLEKPSSKRRAKKRNRLPVLSVGRECLDVMRQTLSEARSRKLLDDSSGGTKPNLDDEAESGELLHLRQWRRPELNESAAARSQELQANRNQAHPLKDSKELPMHRAADEVLSMIDQNHYSLIIGETGSGKTTQVPQLILDQAIDQGIGGTINIICTQPRRIAATSVAARVAEERGEELGETVGYHIRHDVCLPEYGGSMTYCTTGILLRQLSSSPNEVFDGVSHIILDEIHERDIDMDFTLILLKRAIMARARDGKSIPKIVLMSATMDASIFTNYFNDPRMGDYRGESAVLHVPGRMFPVQRQYLEDFEHEIAQIVQDSRVSKQEQTAALDWIHSNVLPKDRQVHQENSDEGPARGQLAARMPPTAAIVALIVHILQHTESGAILVFLPGIGEMIGIANYLRSGKVPHMDFTNEFQYAIFHLHSLMDRDKRAVFEPSPEGVRKIILATNIAETSITIPDVTVVVDTGAIRTMEYETRLRRSSLRTYFASKSNLEQRAGRAGRVQAGHYYGLFDSSRLHEVNERPVPQMHLADLTQVGLSIRAQRFPVPIAEFLADAVDPPLDTAVVSAVNDLKSIGAIKQDESLTPLGAVLAQLPMHPMLGKMVILGIIFKCLDPILLLGAASEERLWENKHYMVPEDKQKANRTRFGFTRGTYSLQFAMLHVYDELRRAVQAAPRLHVPRWCAERYLRLSALNNIELAAQQLEQRLADAGLLPVVGSGSGSGSPSGDIASFRRHVQFRRQFGPPEVNVNSGNQGVIRMVLAAALQPNMAWLKHPAAGLYQSSYNTSLRTGKAWLDMLPVPRAEAHSQLSVMLYDRAVWTDTSKSTVMSKMMPVAPLLAALFGKRLRGVSPEEAEQGSSARSPAPDVIVESWDSDSTRHMGMMVQLHESGAESADEVVQTLTQFREAMGQLLDQVLRTFVRGQAIEQNPASEVVVAALVRVASATNWMGPRNLDELIRNKSRKSRPSRRTYDEDDDNDDVKDEFDEAIKARRSSNKA